MTDFSLNLEKGLIYFLIPVFYKTVLCHINKCRAQCAEQKAPGSSNGAQYHPVLNCKAAQRGHSDMPLSTLVRERTTYSLASHPKSTTAPVKKKSHILVT